MKPMNTTSIKHCFVAWNPGTDQVALIGHPDYSGRCGPYVMTWGACNSYIHDLDFESRKKMVFIEAMHMIVRDKCDPQAVHKVLLDLEEYIDGCADDMPEVYKRRLDAEAAA